MFDKYEKLGAYHWEWYNDPNHAWYKECVDRIVEFCDDVTVDAGGGDGLVASKIGANHWAIVLDNNPDAFKILLEKGLDFEKLDLEKEELPDYPYAYVCSLNTIEHLKSPKGLINLIRHARKGAIVITDKASDNPGRYHEHEYTPQELVETFKEFKPKYFEIESTEYNRPVTFIGVEIRK